MAAQRWAWTLTLKIVSHASSVVDRVGADADAGVGEEEVDRAERVLGGADQLDVAGLGADVGDRRRRAPLAELGGRRPSAPAEVGEQRRSRPPAWKRRASAAPIPPRLR